MTLNMAGLQTFRAGLADAIDAGCEETADQVLAIRDPLTPVLSGELLDTGTVVQIASGHWQVREGDGLPDARASYTEYGTSKAPAQPHMTPAAEQGRELLPVNIAARLAALAEQSSV